MGTACHDARRAALLRGELTYASKNIPGNAKQLPWSSKLRNGEALRKAYGDKVGFHYYEDEDCAIFWSNDPQTTIGQMVRSIGVLELEEEMARVRQFYRSAGVRI
ncbi:MAG: hypothetical protein ABSH34_07330 [Verrucomicrobiota bacterium]